MIALWMFYAYTARWQDTNRPKCVNRFAAQGLGWALNRLKKAKAALKALGLIEDITAKNEKGRIVGWYVEVFYLSSTKVQRCENPQGGQTHHKCSRSSNINALEVNKSKEDTISDGAINNSKKPIEATWIPKSKQSQRDSLPQVPSAPSQAEFDEFCENELLFQVINYRPDLYWELSVNKWHCWNEKWNKWVRIRDWKKYVIGLNNKIDEQIGL